MKQKTVVWLVILVMVLVLIAGFVWWQWNNITAIHYALQYTIEEQAAMEQETNKIIENISEQFSGVDFSRLPEEAREMLSKGELSEEDAIAILTGKITWEELKNNPGTISSDASKFQFSRVDEMIAQIYVLRSGYTGKIDGLVGQALADYRAKKGTKSELISKYIGLGNALEDECDSKMEALLWELQRELKRTGGDTALVSQIRSAYQTEKSLKKAAIIEKYQK